MARKFAIISCSAAAGRTARRRNERTKNSARTLIMLVELESGGSGR